MVAHLVIKGDITTGIAHTPVVNAQVSILELAETVNTDEEGHYSFGVIPHGNYTLTIVRDGFAPQTIHLEVPTGTTLTRDFELLAA